MLESSFTATTDKVTIALKDGQLIIEDKNGKSLPLNKFRQQQLYERNSNKSDKVLNQVSSNINTIDVDRALTSFDFIFGADTNTIRHNDIFLSFGVLAKCEITEKTDNEYRAKVSCYHTLESSNRKKIENIENYFWIYAIRFILEDNSIPIGSKIALVVDSDLGNLGKFNKRELPLADDFYLPPSFNLIYASADSGMEYLPNKIIRYCDRVAKENLRMRNKCN